MALIPVTEDDGKIKTHSLIGIIQALGEINIEMLLIPYIYKGQSIFLLEVDCATAEIQQMVQKQVQSRLLLGAYSYSFSGYTLRIFGTI